MKPFLLFTNIINERSFGFVFNPTYNGTFYIGGIPEEIKKSNPYSISCKVNNRYSTWNCDLTEVRFNGDVYRNDMPAIFQTNINTIAAPQKFYTYLMTNENAFKNEFDNKICEYHEEDEDNNPIFTEDTMIDVLESAEINDTEKEGETK